MTTVPGIGFLGVSSQNAANQLSFAKAMGRRGGVRSARRRRKSSAKAAAGTRRRRSRRSKKPARLVKGSAAAKRYMASIRRKRK